MQKSERTLKERLSCHNGENKSIDDATLRGVVSISNVKENVCSFENLYKALLKCKRNVMWKGSTAGFYKNSLENANQLRYELLNNKYRISPYTCFVVHEKKDRNIVATKIRDRTVQKSLAENYVYECLSKHLIRDNRACLIGGGTDDSRKRLDCFLHRFYRKHGRNGYVLKIDIKDYFGSTPHDVVKRVYDKYIPDEWARSMMYMIVDSFDGKIVGKPSGIGLGLGSQMTQLTELAVLNGIDHFIKERLRIKYYLRYMDDMILIHEDKEYLKYCLIEIEKRLNNIDLKINTRKTFIQPLHQGIHFLGFSFRLTQTGKVVKTLLKSNVKNYKRKLKKLAKRYANGDMTKDQIDACYIAWRAHANKGNSFKLLKSMDKYYMNLISEANMYKRVTAQEIELEKRLNAEELKMAKRAADIDYIAMMADIEIPEEDEGGEEDA